MKKKLVKLAVIRKNHEDGCPFGLEIPLGCESAGQWIDRLAPLDSVPDFTEKQIEEVKAQNLRLIVWGIMQGGPSSCRYAEKIFPKLQGVQCTYGSTTPGMKGDVPIRGTPYFARIMSGIGLDGLYNNPPAGFYTDNTMRNSYYAVYSLAGKPEPSALEKSALSPDSLDLIVIEESDEE